MNSKGKRNFLRQTSYIEKCKKEDEIRLLRLHLIKKRSTEEIINNIWREPTEYHAQEHDVINLLASFKNQVDRYPTDSINNRCLTKTYLYTVKNRYPRRRRKQYGHSN